MPWKRTSDGLLNIRRVFLSLLVAGFLILYVLLFINPEVGRVDIPLALGLLALSLAGIAGARWMNQRSLDVTTPQELAKSYLQNFFIGFALNEMPLMICFVFVFITTELWPFLVGLPFWVLGMTLLAPSRRNLERRQQQVAALGSPHDLIAAIRQFSVVDRTKSPTA